MKLIITERKIEEVSRKNIVDTLSDKLKKFVKDIIVGNNINISQKKTDSYYTIEIDVTPLIDNLKKISPKFSVPLKKIVIDPSITYMDFSTEAPGYFSDGAQMIYVRMNLGITPTEHEIYKEVTSGKKKADPVKFQEELEKILKKKYDSESEKSKKKVLYMPSFEDFKKRLAIPEFTQSNTVNKENLKLLESASAAQLKSAEFVEKAIKKCTPNSPERHAIINKAFERIGDKFSTLVHEVGHAKQYNRDRDKETDPEKSPRVSQLNSFVANFDRKTKKFISNKFAMPIMQLYSYTNNRFFDATDKRDDFERFFYFSRPIEIDARLKEARLKYNFLRKEDKETAALKLFEYIKKTEEGFAKRINIRAYYQTDELATEELQTKYLYNFYYLMKEDAKDIFSLTPLFQEELDTLKAKVDDIDKKIKMNVKIATTASEHDIKKYNYFLTRDKKYID